MNRRAARFFSAAILGGIVAVLPLGAEDWPRFRGPNGTGISKDSSIPTELIAKHILWKYPTTGKGHSSPIVSKGKIIFQTASPDQTKRYLVAVNLNGKEAWKKEIPGGATKTHNLNSPASSTSAGDAERIYSVFWDGTNQSLYAHDYSGKELWKRDLGHFNNEHGAGMSPMVVGNRVILNNDQGNLKTRGPASVEAFDTKTGEPLWKHERTGFRCCFATPIIVEKPDSGPEVIVASTAAVTAYNPKDGKPIWNHDWKFDKSPLRTVGGPAYLDGVIFATAGDGGGDRSMIALKPDGKGGVTKLWEKKKGTPYVPSMIAYNGMLFWINDKENVAVCADPSTGDVAWSERLGTGSVSASPVLINGHIYSITEAGTIYIFKAAKQFELVSKFELGEGVMASPAVSDGKLYIRGEKNLFCIGK
jgi:outer membrane protein assembly factor BamB